MDLEAILNGPSMTPPGNEKPNFEDPGGSHAAGYALVIVCGVISALAILVRLHSRFVIKKFTLADVFFIIALGFFAGHCYVIYDLAIFPGMFVHQWNLQMRRLSRFLYHISLGSMFYGFTCMFLKIGILLDWLAIFVPVGTRNVMFWTSHALIWIHGFFYIIVAVIEFSQCTPREKIWNPVYQGGYCIQNPTIRNLVAGCLAALSDLIILALPQKTIWSLNTSIQKKVGLSLLFAVGIFACSCALARQVYFVRMLHSDDALYHISGTAVFSMCEMTAGFLIVGIPSIPKAFHGISGFTSSISSLWSRGNQKDSSNNVALSSLSWKKQFNGRREAEWENLDADELALVSVQAPKTTPLQPIIQEDRIR